jgi:hypothetical protein
LGTGWASAEEKRETLRPQGSGSGIRAVSGISDQASGLSEASRDQASGFRAVSGIKNQGSGLKAVSGFSDQRAVSGIKQAGAWDSPEA